MKQTAITSMQERQLNTWALMMSQVTGQPIEHFACKQQTMQSACNMLMAQVSGITEPDQETETLKFSKSEQAEPPKTVYIQLSATGLKVY